MIGGAAIKSLLGPRWTTWARTVTRGLERPSWGSLRRVTPISANYGFDRGTPIDRYYVDKFFTARRHRITGRVLEIQTRDHTRKYGAAVTVSDTLDITLLLDTRKPGVNSVITAASTGYFVNLRAKRCVPSTTPIAGNRKPRWSARSDQPPRPPTSAP